MTLSTVQHYQRGSSATRPAPRGPSPGHAAPTRLIGVPQGDLDGAPRHAAGDGAEASSTTAAASAAQQPPANAQRPRRAHFPSQPPPDPDVLRREGRGGGGPAPPPEPMAAKNQPRGLPRARAPGGGKAPGWGCARGRGAEVTSVSRAPPAAFLKRLKASNWTY